MSDFPERVFHERDSPALSSGGIEPEYLSDFERFMGRFLDEHPEALKEQHDGWRIYWDKKVDLAAQEKAQEDSVPDDCYGFHYTAWRGRKPGAGA